MRTSQGLQGMQELIARQRGIYDSPAIDPMLQGLIRVSPQSQLSAPSQLSARAQLSNWGIHRMLRASRSVFFDTHVEVVSGHHTATYLRFASIARDPRLLRMIVRDMAEWVRRTFSTAPVSGIVAPDSEARLLADGVADLLREERPFRVVLTPYSHETGKIGTAVAPGAIKPGERFLALNDVTTRGHCVGKLGAVITDQGGLVAGMMVFARRDSGQFPLMDELTATHPFYYAADLDLPQWMPDACSLCVTTQPLWSWKEMPEL